MKQMKNKSEKSMKRGLLIVNTETGEDYRYIDKNIYRTGTRYRVRVGDFSGYTTTLEKAKKLRTRFRKAWNSEPVFA